MKFIFDINILISAILIGSSKPDSAYKKAKKLGTILFSNETFGELKEILKRPRADQFFLLVEVKLIKWLEDEGLTMICNKLVIKIMALLVL